MYPSVSKDHCYVNKHESRVYAHFSSAALAALLDKGSYKQTVLANTITLILIIVQLATNRQ